MKQIELSEGSLLNENGELIQAGFSFSLIRNYSRKQIKGLKTRIKEWDYYYVGDDNFGLALTVADNSYMGLVSISILDFKKKKYLTKSFIEFFTFGKYKLPSSSFDGDITISKKKFNFSFINKKGKRRLKCSIKKLINNQDFECDINLDETNKKSMVIATPFSKKRHFYYNQKINCLKAKGRFSLGAFCHNFSKSATGVLDWGRGVWTYKNLWYWSSLSALQDNHYIGFNLGYGFGNTTNASENMFFYDDEAYKLDDVKFIIPKNNKNKDDFLSAWKIVSKNGDIDLKFNPIMDRKDYTSIGLISSDQHQVFGYFNGYITVEGKTFFIKNLLGFAEKVKNKW